jgi:hypothetical protein
MKKLILFFAMIGLAISGQSQNIVQEHFSSYKVLDNYTSVMLTGKMFDLAGHIEVADDEKDLLEFKSIIADIKAFNMIYGSKLTNAREEYVDALKIVQSEFEELMTVDDNDGNFSFYVDESNGVVHELVMVGGGKEHFAVASLTGDMDLRKIGKMTHKFREEGLGDFSKVFDHGADQIRVYPNPAGRGEEVMMNVPEGMIGGTAVIYNLSGANVGRFDISDIDQIVPSKDLPSGQYVLELEHEGVRIKKKIVIR